MDVLKEIEIIQLRKKTKEKEFQLKKIEKESQEYLKMKPMNFIMVFIIVLIIGYLIGTWTSFVIIILFLLIFNFVGRLISTYVRSINYGSYKSYPS